MEKGSNFFETAAKTGSPRIAHGARARIIQALADLGPEIDGETGEMRLLDLLGETLTVLFDLPHLVLLLPDAAGEGHLLHGLLGPPQPPVPLPPTRAEMFLSAGEGGLLRLAPENTGGLFAHLPPRPCTCLPLAPGGLPFACLLVYDCALESDLLSLMALFAARVAARVRELRREQAFLQRIRQGEQLLGMLGALALTESRQELLRGMLEGCAELTGADKGSLMLLDETGENLFIAASRGINRHLARATNMRLGKGIAGRVARSGHALLVRDIETDERIGLPNRPRFATNSFLSMPLRSQGAVLGVLNLSDKADGAPFGENDLHTLTTFLEQSCPLIGRSASLERAQLLEELSVTDPLTGLFNRRYLEQRMEEELNRNSRTPQPLSTILLDLDHFKEYNDRCGHLGGDQALRRIAQLLQASAREVDIVTRYGGEEFCILLPATAKHEGRLVAERMRQSIEKEDFDDTANQPQNRLTASFGIATSPGDGSSAQQLLKAADLALYQAKNQGRNRVVLYKTPLLRDNLIVL